MYIRKPYIGPYRRVERQQLTFADAIFPRVAIRTVTGITS